MEVVRIGAVLKSMVESCFSFMAFISSSVNDLATPMVSDD